MRPWSLLVTVALGVVVAACGSTEQATSSTSSVCVESTEAYLDALEDAPDEVRIDDNIPLGNCLPREQDPGEIAEVGALMIEAARELNKQVLRAPLSAPAGQV